LNESLKRRQATAQAIYFIRAALMLCVFLYGLLWSGAVFSHLFFGGVAENQNWLGSLFLFLAGAIIFLTAQSKSETAMLIGFTLFGFTVEALGVHSGFPFGAYQYTETLGLQIFGVPVVIALAWMTLISFVREMLLPWNLPRLPEALIAAFWVTAIDLIIDPLAVHQLGYWRWASGGFYYGIPLTNFAGWFFTTFAAFFLFQQKTAPNLWRLHLGFSIILFFTVLALIYQMFLAALIGAGLCLPYFFRVYRLYQKKEV
jgi:bisanhydrobacterioruberin hydratase